MPHPLGDELTELHVHLGGAVDPAAMWGIAHAQGIRLPTKDYWEFVDLITVNPKRHKSFEDFLELYHWTELIQSSPIAVEQSVYAVIGGAYRKANITTLELRYNPLKRNRGGEQDLDHIIMASIRGLDRAALEYPVKAGLIFCLDRTFDLRMNEIVVDKAIQYHKRGVLAIDIAGPHNADFRYREYAPLFKRAKKAGLGVTVHAGEDEDWHSVDEVVRDLDELREFIAVFRRHKVHFSFNTDGPEMLQTTLRDELKLAVRANLVSRDELEQCGTWAREASFLLRAEV